MDDQQADIRRLLEENAALKAQLAQAQTTVNTSGGASSRDVHTSRDFIGRDYNYTVINNQYAGPPPQDDTAKRRIYLDVLAQMVSRLPIRAYDTSQSNPNAPQRELSLINVYTELDTTERLITTEEHRHRRNNAPLMDQKNVRPMRALESAAIERRLVLLGEPGSGKSSFAHHLIYCLAQGKSETAASWYEAFRRDWPTNGRDLLPVRVILRDFDAWLGDESQVPSRATPRHLVDFIAHTLRQQNLDFALPLIEQALDTGRALVVLDGLDEVTTLHKRAFVNEVITAFAMTRYPRSRVLVTCRTWSYQPPRSHDEPDPRLGDFYIAELAPFDDIKIDQFIAAWHAELVRAGKLDAAKAQALQPKLQRAVRQHDLRRLARNPLQLTLMAWVHTDDEELPDKRAKLYARAVELLLWKWETQKSEGAGARTLRDLAAEVQGGDGKGKIERLLWQAAYEAHAQITPQDQRDNPDKLADVNEAALKQALAHLKQDARGKPDENWARDVVDALKERSGLLAQRLPGVLTFPHRTFQEYLAGLWLLDQDLPTLGSQKAAQFDVWREVILLAAGHMAYNMKPPQLAAPLLLVRRLCPAQCDDTDTAWRKVWLAGEALAEMDVARASEQDDETVQRVQAQLTRLITQGKLAPTERAQAGDTLARIGDPRFDPEMWYLPNEPLLGFVEIPAGPFYMGTCKRDFAALMQRLELKRRYRVHLDEIWPDDQPLDLPRYYIARYPVTVAQFSRFVQDSGFQVRDPDCLRDEATRRVRYVTWHEAIAYCDWLTDQLRQHDGTPEPLRSLLREQLWRVTLPSEAEWEKAARGPAHLSPSPPVRGARGERAGEDSADNRRIFPWGDNIPSETNNDYANIDCVGISDTCTVGCFPKGEETSVYKCHDLIGNVWEWTRSIYMPYPYMPDQCHEDLRAGDDNLRVVRGGAFYLKLRFTRCACRYKYGPSTWGGILGFRAVVCPFTSGR